MSYHIISYHLISYHTIIHTPYDIISYHNISHHITSYHIISYYHTRTTESVPHGQGHPRQMLKSSVACHSVAGSRRQMRTVRKFRPEMNYGSTRTTDPEPLLNGKPLIITLVLLILNIHTNHPKEWGCPSR